MLLFSLLLLLLLSSFKVWRVLLCPAELIPVAVVSIPPSWDSSYDNYCFCIRINSYSFSSGFVHAGSSSLLLLVYSWKLNYLFTAIPSILLANMPSSDSSTTDYSALFLCIFELIICYYPPLVLLVFSLFSMKLPYFFYSYSNYAAPTAYPSSILCTLLLS